MTWIKVDDRALEHPKLVAVGPLGMALWFAGLAYCNRNLTDGFIPWGAARSLLSWEFLGPEDDTGRDIVHITVSVGEGAMRGANDVDSEYVIDLLLDAGLWTKDGPGYRVHDYSDYQPSKQTVLAERAAARGRMANVRANKSDSSGEVQPNNGGSSGYPVPVPVPTESLVSTEVLVPRTRAGIEHGERVQRRPMKRIGGNG